MRISDWSSDVCSSDLFMQRAERRMAVIIPITVISLFVLLFMGLRSVSEALMVMVAVPLSLVGGFWLLYLLDYQMSVAVGVGLIALAGVAAEFGVVMLVYQIGRASCRERVCTYV